MKAKKQLRCKNCMYEQQLSHLPRALTENDIYDYVSKKLNPKRFAIGVHEFDKSENDTPVEAHVHIMMSFDNARSLASIAKILGDKPQSVAKWDERADNGYAYLCHRTAESRGKYPYDPKRIRANFDYPAFLSRYEANAQKAQKSTQINSLMDALKDGTVSLREVEEQLTGAVYGKYYPQFQRIEAYRLRKSAEEWREKACEEHREINVIWIYGESGTGKTRLARKYAESRNQPYFISGSSRDIFQSYSGQHTIILDELRPRYIPYSDLLRLTDPYGITNEIMAPARYADKAIACDFYLVTSPYNPFDFFRRYGISEYDNDSFAQLERRITTTILMTDAIIQRMIWNSESRLYIPVMGSTAVNLLSAANQQAQDDKAGSIFEEVIASSL